MTLRPIRTDADYEAALARAADLMAAPADTPETDELDVLATLIERYEDETAPILPPDPVDAVLFRLEQAGRPPQDLREILGVTRGRLSEILNRKRPFSLDMMRTLARELGVPAEALMQAGSEPEAREAPRRVRAERAWRHAAGPRAAASPSSFAAYPDAVEAHLRADRLLDPDAADLLSEMFRAAYAQAARRSAERAEMSSRFEDATDAP